LSTALAAERHVGGAGALGGKEQEHGDQGRRADHDIAIDGKHAHQLGAVEQRSAWDRRLSVAETAGDQDAEHEPGRFRGDGGNSSAGDAASSASTSKAVAAMLMTLIAICHAERKSCARLSDQPASTT